MNWINPLNTEYTVPFTIFCISLFLIFAYLIFIFLKRLKIKMDYKIATSVFPFVIIGSLLRVCRDMSLLKSQLFETPGIYLLMTSFYLSLLTLFRKLKIEYDTYTFLIGLALLSFLLPIFSIKNFSALYMFCLIFFPLSLLFYFLPIAIEDKIVLILQSFDGTVTSIAIQFFGYKEKHILPTLFIRLTNFPFIFLLIKILTTALVLFILNKYVKEKEVRNYLKLLIAILPLGTGTRDLVRLLMKV